MTTINQKRYTRYQGAIPAMAIARAETAVIGCGAVGRQVVLQLAAMGVGGIMAVDFDKVSEENLGCQGWSPDHVGDSKVEVLKREVLGMNPQCVFFAEPSRFNAGMVEQVDVVFCCVDNMDVRKEVFLASKHKHLFVEARMGLETGRVFFVSGSNAISQRYWLKEWFPHSEAEPDKCSERSTIYCANAVASVMVSGMTKMLRDHPRPIMTELNLNAMLARSIWEHEALEELGKRLSEEEIIKLFGVVQGSNDGYYCEYRLCANGVGKGIKGKHYYKALGHGVYCSPLCGAKQRLLRGEIMPEGVTPEALGIVDDVDQDYPESGKRFGRCPSCGDTLSSEMYKGQTETWCSYGCALDSGDVEESEEEAEENS